MSKVYLPTEQCAKCKGQCCKKMGCHFSPTDFAEISFESLKAEIEKGYISIDWWEGDTPQYYLRIRHKNAPVVDPSWGGECILLTEQGCPLSFEKRPLGARALKPRSNNAESCISDYTKEACKNDWLQYDTILKQLVNLFRERGVEE